MKLGGSLMRMTRVGRRIGRLEAKGRRTEPGEEGVRAEGGLQGSKGGRGRREVAHIEEVEALARARTTKMTFEENCS